MPNRLAEYFDEDDAPRLRVIPYRSADVRMDQGDRLIGKIVVIGVFAVPAILFTIVLICAWMIG